MKLTDEILLTRRALIKPYYPLATEDELADLVLNPLWHWYLNSRKRNKRKVFKETLKKMADLKKEEVEEQLSGLKLENGSSIEMVKLDGPELKGFPNPYNELSSLGDPTGTD